MITPAGGLIGPPPGSLGGPLGPPPGTLGAPPFPAGYGPAGKGAPLGKDGRVAPYGMMPPGAPPPGAMVLVMPSNGPKIQDTQPPGAGVSCVPMQLICLGHFVGQKIRGISRRAESLSARAKVGWN